MNCNKAKTLALNLMELHGLRTDNTCKRVLWSFAWTRRVYECGHCDFTKRVIALSRPITETNELSEVRDTILHEIAHALAGSRHGHDYAWKTTALAIGARPEQLTRSVGPVGKYVAICPNCGYNHYAYRLIRRAKLCAMEQCKLAPINTRRLMYTRLERV